jgi:hypothetical protein
MVLLIGTWIILYWTEALFTESHLVGYYCCVSEQDLPASGTFERMVNDFFRYSPGKYLPSTILILINVSLFIATIATAHKKYWLPFLFIFFNIIFVIIDFELITASWFISDWLVGPQTTVYKGYHRTGYGIVLHLALWSGFLITLWKVRASLKILHSSA